MYETEVDGIIINSSQMPSEIKKEFMAHNLPNDDFIACTPLQWEEHCTECAAPSCYQTCNLFLSRPDGKCRRFDDGIVKYQDFKCLPVIKIKFKQWASLLSTTNYNFISKNDYNLLEQKANKYEMISKFFHFINGVSFFGRKGLPVRLARRAKGKLKDIFPSFIEETSPSFDIEIYNPSNTIVSLTFTSRAKDGHKNKFPYQKKLEVVNGYNSFRVPLSEMVHSIDFGQTNFVTFTPNREEENSDIIDLYFRQLGVYCAKLKYKTVKVLVWDLDNTLWNGILVEDKDVTLKEGILDVIKELDRRGIVQSIASKNDFNNAWQKLKELGIEQYFLFPQISWGPKSNAIRKIVADFNVNIDTVAFIDDSKFERNEVQSISEKLRVFEDDIYSKLLGMPEFSPTLSSESANRRNLYADQQKRTVVEEKFDGEYLGFLKNCEIKVEIITDLFTYSARVYELSQRTNQMNFSTNRYTKVEIEEIINSDSKLSFAVRAKDKFGDYGIIGFAVYCYEEEALKDLMFSCRVQSKRIEHEVILALFKLLQRTKNIKKFRAYYKKTERNKQSGMVFEDLGFKQVSKKANLLVLELKTPPSKTDEIMTVEWI